ncbi:MAG: bacterioferritin [Myxococcota bacterium]
MALKVDKAVIDGLNTILTNELTAINQYFLHAKMCQNWGYERLYQKIYHESIDEMKHADHLIERILYLGGLPNLQRLGKLTIGETVDEQLRLDMAFEIDKAIPDLRDVIELCEKHRDYASRTLLDNILVSEEEHVDWIEAQLDQIGQMGLSAYLSVQVRPEDD